jgi:molybdopterin synthase sulfur carrier subunit
LVKIEFLGPINKESIKIDAKWLHEVGEILRKDPELSKWLDKSAVAVNDEIITSDEKFLLLDGDRISILPPVSGG